MFSPREQASGSSTAVNHYNLLPSHGRDVSRSPSKWPSIRVSPRTRLRDILLCLLPRRRRIIQFLLGLILLYVLFILRVHHWILSIHLEYPPLYEQYIENELALPQHDPDLPFPEGREGRYLFVASHIEEYGWGNYMQELVLNAYLAHRSGRAFVFDNYTWNRHGPEYSVHFGKIIPSRIPLTALLAGPIIGEPFPDGDSSPRAVHQTYFNEVCPNPTKLDGKEITDPYLWDSTDVLVEKLLEKFESVDDRCIEIVEGSGSLFPVVLFGSINVLGTWPDLAQSPILTAFRWSHIVESGFSRNLPFIYTTTITTRDAIPTYPYTTLPGLLVLQLRRGDYVRHCKRLFGWSANWEAFNSFPQFPDQFDPEMDPDTGVAVSYDTYMKRCYPTPTQIAARVQEILDTSAGNALDSVYIMTNGDEGFIEEVKDALKPLRKWNLVKSSRDLVVDHEQRYIKQAIDMLIGLRADVIIGNGWSSMSSNVAMLRMALLPDLSPDHTRYW
ncbi:hypothetical protein BXZ70DRAFT_66216 [Cristinia sonorae]|uniref:Uncharacterized protein n=1 Tax=Cristinia sonorae TaxID=1940300 RepID=A0A8K0USP6_9AGAR|nr:hypothetical protein BXZ70DRAFT_66216 [Cristinia sonorae]